MDFIERLFHIAPDRGSGLLELAITLTLLLVPTVVVFSRRAKRHVRRRDT